MKTCHNVLTSLMFPREFSVAKTRLGGHLAPCFLILDGAHRLNPSHFSLLYWGGGVGLGEDSVPHF